MMKIMILSLGILFVSQMMFGQRIYHSDSITYDYAGREDEESKRRFLKSFGLENYNTTGTIVVRDGNKIQTETDLENSDNLSVMMITIESYSDYRNQSIGDSIKISRQNIRGPAQKYIYYKQLDYFKPIQTAGSSYVSVEWIEFDKNNDDVYEELVLTIQNWQSIVKIIHCHIQPDEVSKQDSEQ